MKYFYQTHMKMMNCPACGQEIPEEAEMCVFCGKILRQARTINGINIPVEKKPKKGIAKVLDIIGKVIHGCGIVLTVFFVVVLVLFFIFIIYFAINF